MNGIYSVNPSDGSLTAVAHVNNMKVQNVVKDTAYVQSKSSPYLSYIDVFLGDITIPSTGKYNISSFRPATPEGKTLVNATMQYYGYGKGPIVIDALGEYLSGNPGTVTHLTARYFYI